MIYDTVTKISPNRGYDSIGQLICENVIIAREGSQDYYEHEIYEDKPFSNKIVTIKRPWHVVEASIPSFEGKPFTAYHTEADVDIDIKNLDEYRAGHVQDVRADKIVVDGKEIRVLKSTLVVNKQEVIDAIVNKEMEDVSSGYHYEIDYNTLELTEIRGEHIALVPKGRAGIAKIIDADKVNGNILDSFIYPMNDKKYNLIEDVRNSKYTIRKIDSKLNDSDIVFEGISARTKALKKVNDMKNYKLIDRDPMPLDRDRVSWINAYAHEAEVGNIISKKRSTRPLQIIDIEKTDGEFFDLIFTYVDVGFEELGEGIYEVSADTKIDILVDSDSYKKINLSNVKDYFKEKHTN